MSKQLDKALSYLDESRRRADCSGAMTGPLKRFVLPVLEPYPECRIVGRTQNKNGDWIAQLFSFLTDFPGTRQTGKRGKFVATKAVVFGRSRQLDRWIVVYGETFPTTRRAFNNALSRVTHADDAECWCVVWGRAPAQPRQVVSLFSDRWMLYDRYGQFRFTDGCCYGYGQAHLLRSATSPVPSARAGPQAQVGFTPDPRFDDSDEDWGVRGREIDPDMSASFMLPMSMKMIRIKDPFPTQHTNRMTVEERPFPNWY